MGLGQEAKELAAGSVEGALFGFGLMMREQRSAVSSNVVANNLLDRPPTEAAIHLQPADDFATENPDVVAVLAQRLAR
jgi:hypothetical protein